MNEQDIKKRLCHYFSDATIETSGENCNFEVYIISPEFDGISQLQRQQSVLSLFSEELKSGQLHALSVKAKTPHEFNSVPFNNDLVQIQG